MDWRNVILYNPSLFYKNKLKIVSLLSWSVLYFLDNDWIFPKFSRLNINVNNIFPCPSNIFNFHDHMRQVKEIGEIKKISLH